MSESTPFEIRSGAIVAMSEDRVIGLNGGLPWHYSADLKRFKRRTLDATVIMGRRTWESIGCKPLPQRRNIVITRAGLTDVESFTTVESALAKCKPPIWFIGGAQLYAAGLPFCDIIDVTYVPDVITHPDAVRFPEIDAGEWSSGPLVRYIDDLRLFWRQFSRR
ncbi:MAG: dihydrofolate reductase [Gammaproteobacteria bacterium]|nr:dihydrofolate reductase [Gammaproteobacteria bacterium]MDH3464736.1 dihydrofolate reductase [Gammaproteobacteria bacterium]